MHLLYSSWPRFYKALPAIGIAETFLKYLYWVIPEHAELGVRVEEENQVVGEPRVVEFGVEAEETEVGVVVAKLMKAVVQLEEGPSD